MDNVTVKSPAKVNLILLVLGKRDDGYHELATLFAPLGLSDVIRIERRDDEEITIACPAPFVPEDESNLAVKAARAFLDDYRVKGGVHIEIDKVIPVGSGLGGGSSNAAAVLRALPEIYGLSASGDDLSAIGARLGADIPFFLQDGWAIGRGRGEVLTPVKSRPGIPILLVRPDFGISTPQVYGEMRPDEFSADESALDSLLAALDEPIAEYWPLARNDLEQAVLRVAPRLLEAKDEFWGEGLRGMVSGSGSTVFCPMDDEAKARILADRLAGLGYWTKLTETV
ncbi:MAG: 4-(cytidine 5'-diphospho)-2-C-methyl-D-erythritol kinase [bacterium]|nr:4-(cytidine 5'-diphospho)-2-C-methyl-D-erythritol kinase [bacterium]